MTYVPPKNHSKTISVPVTIDTDVDVDLGELETDDLREELERRGEHAPGSIDFEPLYIAMAYGHNDEALRLAREIVQEATGRILP
jgi:hypothetical protein